MSMKARVINKFRNAVQSRDLCADKSKKHIAKREPAEAVKCTYLQCLEQGKIEAYAQIMWDEFQVKYCVETGKLLKGEEE